MGLFFNVVDGPAVEFETRGVELGAFATTDDEELLDCFSFFFFRMLAILSRTERRPFLGILGTLRVATFENSKTRNTRSAFVVVYHSSNLTELLLGSHSDHFFFTLLPSVTQQMNKKCH